jgi:hypothetical protein
MFNNTTTSSQWKMENVQFNAPKEQRSRFSQKVFINDTSKPRGNTDLKITLPCLYTFGIQPYKDDPEKFSFNLQFPMDGQQGVRTKETDEALLKLIEFENKLLDHMTFKSANYFGSSLSRDAVKSMYRPLLKYSQKKESAPYIPVRIQYYAQEKMFKQLNIIDEKGLPIFSSPCITSPVDFVKKGMYVECELFFSNVWMTKNSFGVEIFATNLQVFSSQNLKNDEEVDEEEEEQEEQEEEYDGISIDGGEYYYQSKKRKKHGSSIFVNGTTIVGCFFNGEPKLFR